MVRAPDLAVVCLALAVPACNLEVSNPNAPDRDRAIQTVAVAENLVASSYNTWFNGVYAFYGPGLFLGNQAFQGTSPFMNSGMEVYGRLPREPIHNDVADPAYESFTWPWYRCYNAAAAVAEGLGALATPQLAAQISAEDLRRDRAFGSFVLGLAHATVALLYDQSYVIDETTRLAAGSGTPLTQPVRKYGQVMSAAMAYFDRALAVTDTGGFTIPGAWIATDAALGAAEFARVIHSMKARYLVEVARTPAERAAVDWPRVLQEVDRGIRTSFVQDMDCRTQWCDDAAGYGVAMNLANYFVWGMADQSGSYQRWLSTPVAQRAPIIAAEPVLIVTPDLRFPRGATLAEQQAHPGIYLTVFDATASIGGNLMIRPDRGTWRWSYYWSQHGMKYALEEDYHWPEIPISEMNLLEAEALYRTGDRAGAASLVNLTRVGIAGLNATDAAGTNTSCVPRLLTGECGGLFEMIKWEKRLEGMHQGLLAAPWFFDSRGWGDLYKGTPLQFPIPCGELQVLHLLPCYTFGGSANPSSAPGSTYRYPGEA